MKIEEKVICLFLVILVTPVALEYLIRVKYLVSLFIKTLFVKDTRYGTDD